MSLLKLTDERPDKAIAKAVQATIADAESNWAPLKFEGEYPISGIGISELRPFHVENGTLLIPQTCSLNCWQTSAIIACSWQDWVNLTIDKNEYLVITGIFDLEATPLTSEIAPSANGIDLPVVNIEQMFGLDEAVVYFSKPFVVKPENNVNIQIYGTVGAGTHPSEKIGLMGYCIAKRERLIDRS
jgi:hypothetical protein